jgi:glutamate--cysteine ligase
MQSTPPSVSDAPVRDIDELEQIFREAEKPREQFRIGAEAEKFGVYAGSLTPLPYRDERSILSIFQRFEAHGWKPVTEAAGAPVIALERGQASITLEPGGQFELSGAPWSDVHGIHREFVDHFAELGAVSRELGLVWWSLGFHPTAKPEQLPWVPKERYAIMKDYVPSRGRRGRDMMQRTSTVQANFDYDSEEDAMRKLLVVLKLSPVFQATFANSPFIEGRVSELRSERLDVWLNMDPERSGLIPRLWGLQRPRYRDYVAWALDAGMFFIKRGSRIVLNTGQTFRDFLAHGFEAERATLADWFRHLATLFPEARLKSTLEVRTCDAQSEALSMAVPALFTGLLYDDRALAEAEELAREVTLDVALASRAQIPMHGLSARLGARPIRELAERLLDISGGGLTRRARFNDHGQDEAIYLLPLSKLVAAGQSPADELRGKRAPGSLIDESALERVRVAAANE